jgi:hypothetical protein
MVFALLILTSLVLPEASATPADKNSPRYLGCGEKDADAASLFRDHDRGKVTFGEGSRAIFEQKLGPNHCTSNFTASDGFSCFICVNEQNPDYSAAIKSGLLRRLRGTKSLSDFRPTNDKEATFPYSHIPLKIADGKKQQDKMEMRYEFLFEPSSKHFYRLVCLMPKNVESHLSDDELDKKFCNSLWSMDIKLHVQEKLPTIPPKSQEQPKSFFPKFFR